MLEYKYKSPISGIESSWLQHGRAAEILASMGWTVSATRAIDGGDTVVAEETRVAKREPESAHVATQRKKSSTQTRRSRRRDG